MLHPFFPDDLKSASYEAHLGGRFIMWDGQGNRIDTAISRGDPCTLPANSIAYVQVEPRFRLPYYIALRFNLRITHVHRGLLLGTGPLVDPGFDGQLLIPLHNLTALDYHVDTTKALIWIEFTKTTYGFIPAEEEATFPRRVFHFPPEKTNLTPETYLQKASGGQQIRSSIPALIQDSRTEATQAADAAAKAKESAQKAKEASDSARRTLTRIGIGAVIAIVIALATIVFQVYGLIQGAQSLSSSISRETEALTARTDSLVARMTVLQANVEAAQRKAMKTSGENDELTRRILELEAELDELRQISPQP